VSRARGLPDGALVAAVLVGVWAAGSRAQSGITLSLSSPSAHQGDVIVLTIEPPDPLGPVQVEAFGRRLPAFFAADHTWKALVGVDFDARKGTYPLMVTARAGPRSFEETTRLEIEPRTFPTRRLSVNPAFVNPPPELETRILREAHELEALWSASAPSKLWDGPFVPPVSARPTGQFGTRSLFNGQPRSRHAGEDFPAPEGTPVVAPNAGRIVLARDLYFAGNTVVIDHGLGCFSLLEHLSSIDVAEGDQVRPTQPIGRVGATGRVTGPHLHWAVRLSGARIDPLKLLAVPAL
jgi:hypothetical protein